MGYAQETTDASGVNVKFERDPITGLLLQNSGSNNSGTSRTALGDVWFGTPFVVCAFGTFAGGDNDQTVEVKHFNADCPMKCRIIRAWVHTIETGIAGGAPDETLQLFNGADACTSTIDGDAESDDAVTDFATIIDAKDTIAKDGSLSFKHVVSGSVTSGTSQYEVYVMLIPIK